ncbi:MAG: nitrous oxide reductase accessory protein NosL [Acetobacteraceae bacterium]|nr:nitrous oxide reductase accessory protein NosL [Pseudomonadota bacterium]
MKPSILGALALLALVVAGCNEEDRKAALPAPQDVTDAAIGQFCGMALVEHPGPKGQIFVRGDSKPFWFASVHDAIAFTMLPEMPKNIAAIYVTDMARARDWNQPEPGIWIEARQAVFVIGSARRTGMDTDEAIPFSDPEAARQFAAANGGRVVRFGEMPQSYILASSGSAQ